jgi:hypothetical protein
MKSHLTSEEISAAVAGLEIDAPARDHLEGCVVCRAEGADLERRIAIRRRELRAEAPDWDVQTRQIMDRLPAAAGKDARRHRRWLRPVLALAAVLVLAVGLGILRSGGSAGPPAPEPSVEDILAEMDELLSDDSIPGFEIIDPWIDDHTMDFGYIEPTPSESVG